MNIEEKVQQAIQEIEAMSAAELEQEFIKHGYRPTRKVELEYNISGVFLVTGHGYKKIETRSVGTENVQHHFHTMRACDNDEGFELAA